MTEFISKFEVCYKGTELYITKEAQENTSRKGIFDMYIHID